MTENPAEAQRRQAAAAARPEAPASQEALPAPEKAAPEETPSKEALARESLPKEALPKAAPPKEASPSGALPRQALPRQALPQETPSRTALLPNRAALLLGLALALAATEPAKIAERDPVGWLLTLAFLVGAIWAAPVVAQRPAATAVHWMGRLSRHRNTVFAVSCVIIAGFGDPPVWQMVIDAALLLAYLLTVDVLAAGPIGIRQLRRGMAPAAAAVASAVTLLAAHAPVDTGAVWGRVVAAVAVAAAALAAGAALWVRQHELGQREAEKGELKKS